MANLNTLTISEARDKLKSKDISSLELTNSCLSAIDAADALGAFVHKTPELAIEQAKRADERLKKENPPDLCGIPLGIKDLFCTKGVESQDLTALAKEFNDILGFIEQLNEVDVEGIEPMTSVTPQKLIRRSDNITDGDKQTSVLKNAPLSREGFYAVPKVVE